MIEILRFQVENKKQPTNRKSAIFYDVHGQSLNFPGKTRKKRRVPRVPARLSK
jgi:hypothetical protein